MGLRRRLNEFRLYQVGAQSRLKHVKLRAAALGQGRTTFCRGSGVGLRGGCPVGRWGRRRGAAAALSARPRPVAAMSDGETGVRRVVRGLREAFPLARRKGAVIAGRQRSSWKGIDFDGGAPLAGLQLGMGEARRRGLPPNQCDSDNAEPPLVRPAGHDGTPPRDCRTGAPRAPAEYGGRPLRGWLETRCAFPRGCRCASFAFGERELWPKARPTAKARRSVVSGGVGSAAGQSPARGAAPTR